MQITTPILQIIVILCFLIGSILHVDKINAQATTQKISESSLAYLQYNTSQEKYMQKPVQDKLRTKVSKAQISVLAGLAFTDIKFLADNPNAAVLPLVETDYDVSINPIIGVGLNIGIPTARFSLNNELFFTSFKCKGFVEYTVSSSEFGNLNSELGLTQFKLANMLRFRQAIGSLGGDDRNLAIFAHLGIVNSVGNAKTNTETDVRTAFTITNTTEDLLIKDIRNHEIGGLFGLGIRTDHLSLEGRYELGNGFSKARNYTMLCSRINVMVGYTF